MIQYILEMSLIWSIMILFYIYLLKKETFFNFNRVFLMATVLLGLLLPLINIPIRTIESTVFATVLQGVTIVGDDLNSTNLIEESNQIMSVTNLILIAYLIPSVLILLKLIDGIRKVYLLYQQGRKIEHPDYTEVIIDKEINPFSFFHLMFIPSSLKESDYFEIVKCHEKKHIREVHSLDIMLIELIKIVFWFNPLVYLLKQEMIQVHEYIADEATIKESNRKKYSQLLISFRPEPVQFTLVNSLKNSIIKNRIIMMYQMKSKELRKLKYLLFLPFLLAMFYLVSCTNDINQPNHQYDYMVYGVENEDGSIERVKVKKGEEAPDNYEYVLDPQQLKGDKDRENLEKFLQNGKAESINEELVFKVVEEMPRFPGCEGTSADGNEIENCAKQKMLQYIYTNLKYPQKARENGVEGMVVAEFVINEKGEIVDVDIVRDIGSGCGEEVEKVVKSMNDMEERWIPGKQRGQKVKVKYTLPVRFKLGN